jgi:hypothetical protein
VLEKGGTRGEDANFRLYGYEYKKGALFGGYKGIRMLSTRIVFFRMKKIKFNFLLFLYL